MLFALIACQASLIGIWAGLGKTYWFVRLLVLSVSSIYLGYVLGAGIDEIDFWTFLLVVIEAFLPAAIFFVLRLLRAEILRLHRLKTGTV